MLHQTSGKSSLPRDCHLVAIEMHSGFKLGGVTKEMLERALSL
jgi:hypothetical protein